MDLSVSYGSSVSYLGDTGGDTREEEILNKVQLASHDYLKQFYCNFFQFDKRKGSAVDCL